MNVPHFSLSQAGLKGNDQTRKRIQSQRSIAGVSMKSYSLAKGACLHKRTNNFGKLGLFLTLALLSQSLFGWPQDIAGGASALVGQDIMGGASVAFKRPPRVRDPPCGATPLILKRG